MKNKNSNVNVDFSQLKYKVLDVINYSNELLENNSFDNMALLEDIILTEMNDLLMGIDSGNIVIPDYKLKLSSTYYITDGAITDKKLEQLLLIVQNEIYSIKDSIKYLSTLLDVRHKVLPISEDANLTLVGKTTEGITIEGEAEITKSNKKIEIKVI